MCKQTSLLFIVRNVDKNEDVSRFRARKKYRDKWQVVDVKRTIKLNVSKKGLTINYNAAN